MSMAQASKDPPKASKPAPPASISRTRSQDQRWEIVQAGLQKMAVVDAGAQKAALTMLDKLISNVLKHPDEAKYRTVWLSNAKVGKCLRAADGSVMVLEGSMFEPGPEADTLVYSNTTDPSNNLLYRTHDAIKSQLYLLVGRPTASGELGSTATVGKMLTAGGHIGDDKKLAARVASSGGVCAPKFEALDTEEFTIEQCQRVQDAFEHLRGANPPVVCQGLLEQLKVAMEAIMREPEDQELRQLPLPVEVVEIEGARGLATAMGFDCMMIDQHEEMLLCPLSVPILRSVLDQMAQFQNALAAQRAAEADQSNIPASPVIPDRDTRVLQFKQSGSAALLEVPESFFQLRQEDLQLTQQSGKVHKVKSRKYTRCLLRVQLPDNTVLQAVFAPQEKVAALQEFVTSTLEEPYRPFSLSVGTQELQMQRSLWDSGLVPSALLHFRWLPMEGLEPSTAMLTPELTARIEQVS